MFGLEDSEGERSFGARQQLLFPTCAKSGIGYSFLLVGDEFQSNLNLPRTYRI